MQVRPCSSREEGKEDRFNHSRCRCLSAKRTEKINSPVRSIGFLANASLAGEFDRMHFHLKRGMRTACAGRGDEQGADAMNT